MWIPMKNILLIIAYPSQWTELQITGLDRCRHKAMAKECDAFILLIPSCDKGDIAT